MGFFIVPSALRNMSCDMDSMRFAVRCTSRVIMSNDDILSARGPTCPTPVELSPKSSPTWSIPATAVLIVRIVGRRLCSRVRRSLLDHDCWLRVTADFGLDPFYEHLTLAVHLFLYGGFPTPRSNSIVVSAECNFIRLSATSHLLLCSHLTFF